MNEKKEALRAKDLQKVLGIGQVLAYKLMRREDFPSYRLGRNWYVTREDLSMWLEGQKHAK